MRNLLKISKQLDLSPEEKTEVMRELASHYYETRDELMAAGMSEAQAEEEANRRIGTPEEVSAQLSAVHNSSTLKSSLLAAVPFMSGALNMFVQSVTSLRVSVVLLAVYAAVMLAGSVRELWRGMRPIWLASWLAASIVAMRTITFLLACPTGYQEGFNHKGSYLACIGTTAIVVALTWGRPKWRYTAAILGLLHILSIAMIPSGRLVYTPRLGVLIAAHDMIPNAQLMLLAVNAFYLHPYGNLARALLFLVTTSTLALAVSIQHYALYPWIMGMLVVAVIIVFFALNSKSAEKVILALIAITTYKASSAIGLALVVTKTHSPQVGISAFFIQIITGTLGGAMVILIPVIYDRLRRRRQNPSELAT